MRRCILIVAAVLSALSVVSAREYRLLTREAAPAHRVPYRLSETLHMIVRIKLCGAGPFNMIVDTGAPAMFVTTDTAQKAGVRAGPDGWATFDRMEIEGGAQLEQVKARVEDIFQIRGMNGLGLPGVRLDGVIGYTVLARYRMDIDLSKTAMTWTKLDFDPPLPRPLAGGDAPAGASSAPPELQAVGGLMQLAGALLGRTTTDSIAARGFLGIELDEADGAVHVKRVLAGGPAEQAGVAPGDRLREFLGKPVQSTGEVFKLFSTVAPGDEVPMSVLRNGKTIDFSARAGEGF
jgi:hypothetical protein